MHLVFIIMQKILSQGINFDFYQKFNQLRRENERMERKAVSFRSNADTVVNRHVNVGI